MSRHNTSQQNIILKACQALMVLNIKVLLIRHNLPFSDLGNFQPLWEIVRSLLAQIMLDKLGAAQCRTNRKGPPTEQRTIYT